MKYKIRKQNGNQNTQLVDWHNDTCQTILQRTVIAQPGSTGGKSGQADKAKFPVINRAHTVLLFRDKHDDPCHDQYDDGTDGCSQIGINIFNADFSQNRSQAGKDSRAECIEEPAPAFFAGIFRRSSFFGDHQVGSHADQQHAQKFQWADALMQEEKSEKNGEDGTRFIDRDHLIHISDLQCTEIAQPGSAGGKSRQDQKRPGFDRNISDAVLSPDQKYHDP